MYNVGSWDLGSLMSLYCYLQFFKDSTLQHLVQHPLFINLGHKTLKKALVKVQPYPTTEQLFRAVGRGQACRATYWAMARQAL